MFVTRTSQVIIQFPGCTHNWVKGYLSPLPGAEMTKGGDIYQCSGPIILMHHIRHSLDLWKETFDPNRRNDFGMLHMSRILTIWTLTSHMNLKPLKVKNVTMQEELHLTFDKYLFTFLFMSIWPAYKIQRKHFVIYTLFYPTQIG